MAMAEQAADECWRHEGDEVGDVLAIDLVIDAIERVARAAVEQEREACAELCRRFAAEHLCYPDGHDHSGCSERTYAAEAIEGEIRARGGAE